MVENKVESKVFRAAMRQSKHHENFPYNILNKIDKMSIAPKRFKISQNPSKFRPREPLLSDFL